MEGHLSIVLQVFTIVSIIGVGVGALRQMSKQEGILQERVKTTSETTLQIKTDLREFARDNEMAHLRIHKRLEDLPCTTEAERLARLEGQLKGLQRGDT